VTGDNGDNGAFSIDKDRDIEAKRLHAACEQLNLLAGMPPLVLGIGFDGSDWERGNC
jgi:hypothetical protein